MASGKGKRSAKKRDRKAERRGPSGAAARAHGSAGKKPKVRARPKTSKDEGKETSTGKPARDDGAPMATGRSGKARQAADAAKEAVAAPAEVPVESRVPPALPVPIASFTF